MCDFINYRPPFVCFYSLSVKPAILLLCLFLLVCMLYLSFGGVGISKLSIKGLTEAVRRKAIITGVGYILICLFFSFPQILLEEDSALLQLANALLGYETLLSAALFLATFGGAAVKGNRHRYLQTIFRLVGTYIPICVFINLATKTIDLCDWPNLIGLLLLGFLTVSLNLIELYPKPAKDKGQGDVSEGKVQIDFSPKEKAEDLFPSRRYLMDRLIEYIKTVESTPSSICVTGEWGIGKTSLVRVAINELRAKNPNQYDIIWINALELDSPQSLITYTFSQIKRCLRARGVYVGIGSEYRRFVSSVTGILSSSAFTDAVSALLNLGDKDYRTEKKVLSDLIKESIGKGRILIVVDDIERCEREKALQFIFLIKEVLTMDGCTAVFVTNQEMLDVLRVGYTKDKNDMFFDKFFNFRMDIRPAKVSEAQEILKGVTPIRQDIRPRQYKEPDTVILRWGNALISQRCSMEDQYSEDGFEGERLEFYRKKHREKIMQLTDAYNRLENILGNPRIIIKIRSVLDGYHGIINRKYTPEIEGVQDYFAKIGLDEVLLLMAFVEACFHDEALLMRGQGANYFRSLVIRQEQSDAAFLISTIAGDRFCSTPIFSNGGSLTEESYTQKKTMKFVDIFLEGNYSELPQIVNGYTTEELEWFGAIEGGRLEELDSVWTKAVTAVLKEFGHAQGRETGEKYLRSLFQYACEKIEEGRMVADDFFSFLEPSKYALSSGIPIMGIALETTESRVGPLGFSQVSKNYIVSIMNTFMGNHFSNINVLFHYFVFPTSKTFPEDREIIRDASEIAMLSFQTPREMLASYMERISKIHAKPFPISLDGDCVPLLQETVKIAETHIKDDTALWEYEDVQEDIQRAKCSANEIAAYIKLNEFLAGQTIDNDFQPTPESISKVIVYFKSIFDSQNPLDGHPLTNDVIRTFDNMFKQISDNMNEYHLSGDDVQDLHDLVTAYYKSTGRAVVWYRSILECYTNTKLK